MRARSGMEARDNALTCEHPSIDEIQEDKKPIGKQSMSELLQRGQKMKIAKPMK